MNYFITAIGTNSGKTIVSAILCEALKADYWKPVQAGFPTDSCTVKKLLTNDITTIHVERYLLNTPASPHSAAKTDHVNIEIDDFELPKTNNDLIIEGAGGLMVPLNDTALMLDLVNHLGCAVILVCNLYLGSINHSLLSIEALKNRNIPVKGIIFNGESNVDSETVILRNANVPKLLHIHTEKDFNSKTILKYAQQLLEKWKA